jgi:hypothetical protein
MGYSVAAPCRSYELRDAMLDMLSDNFQQWPQLNGEDPEGSLYGPRADDLSYHHGRCFIGFDYNCGDGERYYAFALVRWVALKIGRVTPVARVPFYVYDGHEVTPIHHGGKQAVDQWGVPKETPEAFKIRGVWATKHILDTLGEPNALDVIRTEIQRLEGLWTLMEAK